MRNFIQRGEVVTVPAPAGGVLSGNGVIVGSIFGVAAYTTLEGNDLEVTVEGVFDLPKTSAQAWTVGAPIYWDATGKVCTTASSINKLVGVAMLAAANPSPIGRVRLNGC